MRIELWFSDQFVLMEEVNKAKGPTTGLIDALGEALNHLGYEYALGVHMPKRTL